MFRIRNEQLAWFGAKARHDFVEKISTWLEQAYPECVGEMQRDELTAWVDRCVTLAEKNKITIERDVTQFMLLILILGEDAADKHAWFAETLRNTNLAGAGKVRMLIRRAQEAATPSIDDVILDQYLTRMESS